MERSFNVSSACSAFNPQTVGTKFVRVGGFIGVLHEVLPLHDVSKDRVRGQHFITLPEHTYHLVSAGVGRREGRGVNDFVLREHRGHVGAYLQRKYAAPVESLAVVVYDFEAYRADPDVTPEEVKYLEGASHIIVAVLAGAGPQSPLTPGRFVHNLAGGNNEALIWTADEIRNKAKEIKAYSDEWCVVAD